MNLPPFKLERYFARHEFSAKYLLSCSDCEPLTLSELLDMADGETKRLWDGLSLGYTESPGHPLLREEIANLYDGIGPEDILAAAPEECIFLLMHAMLAPGDHVICTYPGYQSLYEVARAIGCEVSFWEPDENRGWRFDVDGLEGLIRENTRLVVVNFPHNPTGYVPEKSEFEAVVDLTRSRGIHLLSDEMYRFLEIREDAALPAACELYERAVSLSGLSKAFGLPGLRMGWLASRDKDLLDRVKMLRDYTTICNGAPSEILAITALGNRTRIIKNQRTRIQRNLAALDAFISENRKWFSLAPPLGGSVCFPRMRGVEDTAIFCDKMVSVAGIMLVSSRQFGYGNAHVRIGFGREDFPEALDRFGKYLV